MGEEGLMPQLPCQRGPGRPANCVNLVNGRGDAIRCAMAADAVVAARVAQELGNCRWRVPMDGEPEALARASPPSLALRAPQITRSALAAPRRGRGRGWTARAGRWLRADAD